MRKRSYVGITLLAALFAPATYETARGQDFPTRSISVVSSVAPGAPIDLLARLFIDRLRRKLGVPVVLDNVTGDKG